MELFFVGYHLKMTDIYFKELTKEELEKALDLLKFEHKWRSDEVREITFAIYEIRKIMIEKGWV